MRSAPSEVGCETPGCVKVSQWGDEHQRWLLVSASLEQGSEQWSQQGGLRRKPEAGIASGTEPRLRKRAHRLTDTALQQSSPPPPL